MIVFSAAHCDYYVMLSATQHGYLKLLVLSIGEAVKFSFTFGLYFTMMVRPQQFFFHFKVSFFSNFLKETCNNKGLVVYKLFFLNFNNNAYLLNDQVLAVAICKRIPLYSTS